MTETETVQRPMRADARRNRERVLEAAESLLADEGLKVHMEAVAQRAGVGVGTVCRNFPTKQSLIDAIVTSRCESLLGAAQQALAEPDAGAAFRGFVVAMADYQARHRALAEGMASEIELPPEAVPVKAQLREAIAQLLARAQEAGAVRADIGPGDMSMLCAGVAHAASVAGGTDPVRRERFLAIVLDGLRPDEASPLPGEPQEIRASRVRAPEARQA